MTALRAAVALFAAALSVITYEMTDWPVVARAALTLIVLIVVMALFGPMWRQDPPSVVDEAPKPAVVDRTPRNGDDAGKDVTS